MLTHAHYVLSLFSFYSRQLRGWEGWTSESIELHLQTRFQQLETASLLHRYTEVRVGGYVVVLVRRLYFTCIVIKLEENRSVVNAFHVSRF
jgi:hypothetical protein